MCMIAGYNGTKRAAPILIEMLRRSEGMNAGCFTGIATLHEGKIHYRKLAGNLDYFLAETDAMDLPGNIGIIHIRTPGGSSLDSWAHPFTCEKDGVLRTAMVLNGQNGCCQEMNDRQFAPILEKIKQAGYPLKSGVALGGQTSRLNHPRDDEKVYQKTDCHTQLISMKILEEEMAPADAMAKTAAELSGENVLLMLSDTAPNVISWCRMNFPLYAGLSDHGVCIASAPIAFAEYTEHYTCLPPLSAGTVTEDHFTVKPITDPPFTVAPITPAIWHDAREVIIRKIKEKDCHFNKEVTALFEKADCAQANAVTWAVLSDLHRQGKIEIEKVLKPGVRDGLFRTTFNYLWKE